MTSVLDLLKESVDELIEEAKRVREADVSDGTRVPFGSLKHVKDLQSRIADIARWRDRQPRGSEARANYARLLHRLKAELASAQRANDRLKMSLE